MSCPVVPAHKCSTISVCIWKTAEHKKIKFKGEDKTIGLCGLSYNNLKKKTLCYGTKQWY